MGISNDNYISLYLYFDDVKMSHRSDRLNRYYLHIDYRGCHLVFSCFFFIVFRKFDRFIIIFGKK